MKIVPAGIERPWLFEVFPEMKKHVSWIPLVSGPTPVHKLENVSSQVGKDTWIKRDDKTSPVYGGNKPRKLEFILADASAAGRTELITGGGLGSNHSLATAVFGRMQGFKVTLGLFPQPVTEHVRTNLLLDRVHGAEMIHFKSLGRAALDYYLIARVQRPRAHFIPPGGSSPTGILGYVDAGLELVMQVESGIVPLPEAIFVAAGTCGTVAGLTLGLKLAGVKTRVVGVQVAPSMLSSHKRILSLARKTLKQMRRRDPTVPDVGLSPQDVSFERNHFGAGYGSPTDAGRSAMRLMADTEGIELDPTYTAKAFAALLEHVKAGSVSGPVLFWHTFNSADLSAKVGEADHNSLPKAFGPYFDGEPLT